MAGFTRAVCHRNKGQWQPSSVAYVLDTFKSRNKDFCLHAPLIVLRPSAKTSNCSVPMPSSMDEKGTTLQTALSADGISNQFGSEDSALATGWTRSFWHCSIISCPWGTSLLITVVWTQLVYIGGVIEYRVRAVSAI